MKPAGGAAKITAAAIALSVTLSMVWGLAALGYPASASASAQLAHTCGNR
jgi:hypothetical protein